MTDDYLQKEGRRLAQALPLYLSAQTAILLTIFLDYPVFMQTYASPDNPSVTPWVGWWFVMFIFGLGIGSLLLLAPVWRRILTSRVRVKYAAGYLLGALAGLLSFGLRFKPIMPVEYFFVIGGLALLGAAAYLTWRRRPPHMNEIFP